MGTYETRLSQTSILHSGVAFVQRRSCRSHIKPAGAFLQIVERLLDHARLDNATALAYTRVTARCTRGRSVQWRREP
jgi:hypothetical protein